MLRLRTTFGVAVLACACGAAQADQAASSAVFMANEAVGVSSIIDRDDYATLSRLNAVDIPGFELDAGRRVELSLERFDVIHEFAQFVVADESGEYEVPRPEVALFRGDIAGEPDSRVFLAISPEIVSGLIELNGETFILSSGPSTASLQARVYSLTNLPEGAIEWRMFTCQSDLLDQAPAQPATTTPTGLRGAGCRVVKIAIETDWEYRQLFGSQSAANAYVVSLVGATSEVYDRDVNTTFSITYVRIWSNSNDPWNQSGATQQLYQYRDYWQANMTHIDKHLGHFLSGRGLGGGVAWLPGLCGGEYEYGLSANLGGSFPYPIQNNHPQNWDLMVFNHELGHNLGSPHTHDMSPPIDGCASGNCSVVPNGTIMSYCHLCSGGMSNVLMEFHTRSINEAMLPFLGDSDTINACGDLVVAATQINEHPGSESVCAGSSVTFNVSASGEGLSYQWRRNGANIGGATSASYTDNNVQPGDAGSYDCVVSGACGVATSDAATLTVCTADLPGDLDANCAVNLEDLAILLANYGTTSGATPNMGDLNGDGDVDLEDLAVLLSGFGSSSCN